MVDDVGDDCLKKPTNWWASLGGYGIWLPDWNRTGEDKPERREASYHGPACGQTGTSTRQELTVWIHVLTLPIRSRYATDSKSIMDKALKLIDAAKVHEQQQTDGPNGNRSSRPFKKSALLLTISSYLHRSEANIDSNSAKGFTKKCTTSSMTVVVAHAHPESTAGWGHVG